MGKSTLRGKGFRKDSGTNKKIMKESPGGVFSHVTESEACSWNSVKTLLTHVPSELPGLPHGGIISVQSDLLPDTLRLKKE